MRFSFLVLRRVVAGGKRSGFTLSELMISMSVMMVVMAGVIYAHISGLKLYEMTKAKLGANAMAREALNNLVAEVRTAKIVKVGLGSLTSFQEIGLGTNQIGSAVQIYPGTATNLFVRYFMDPASSKLMRTTNGTTMREIVAEFITNRMVFTAEDSFGNVLTNNRNNRVIGLTLQFFQIQYPVVTVGQPGSFFDYYQLRTKITRRTLE
jgi:type II secretory pathway pseudopilin PulG